MLTIPRWYLLQCRPQQQARAELNLEQQGFQHYSPVHAVKRVVKGKVSTCNETLFPGYLFIKLGIESNWQALRATRGVSRVVSFNGVPHPVSDSLIEALKQRFIQAAAPKALFDAGQRVVITEGCFKHVEAIVKSVTADERIIVLLKILQTEQALEMNPAQLAKAS